MDGHRPVRLPLRPIVLVVEGHEATRMLYALGLSAMGFDVVAARDRDDACRRVSDMHPDIIVTDVAMPDFNARQFLEDLRQNPGAHDIPVVAVTDDGFTPVQERVRRDGFAACFPKACSPQQLAIGLRRVLDGRTQTHAER
jgi:CheY-like chemotaxis protein